MVVRRWKQANRVIQAQVEARRAAGLPEPEWYEHPIVVIYGALLGAGLVVALVGIAAQVLTPTGALYFGIVIVVVLGAAGQFLRGLGERRTSPKLKEHGYYLGAIAYLATASVALFNGLPRLIASLLGQA
jgi:hypothetical protein